MIEREENNANSTSKRASTTTTSTTTTSWSRLKDPRIVRVSRAFGGKDRHSKVCTVRGLRDRRVRLSVPTAIQLYDLQDRLGLNQPSKVVDWLLNAAKQEIDGLPPLQFPILTPHPDLFIPTSQSSKQGLKTRTNDDEKGNDDHTPYFVSRTPQNPSSSSFSSLLSSTTTMQAPFNSWDPSNLTLSQPSPFNLGLPAQHDQDLHNFHHFLLYQPTQVQPYFASPTNAGFFDQMAKTSKENATSSILPSNNFFGGK